MNPNYPPNVTPSYPMPNTGPTQGQYPQPGQYQGQFQPTPSQQGMMPINGPQSVMTSGQPGAIGFVPSGDSPSAPPLDGLNAPPGYEGATFVSAPLPPPPPPDFSHFVYQQQQITEVQPYTEKDVRDALSEFVDDQCCYSSRPVTQLTIKEIIMKPAFDYKLETFTERRESAWAFAPYEGEPIDGPQGGPAPAPWDVQIPVPKPFEDRDGKFEVPHTAFVRACHKCTGLGRILCTKCDGQGRKRCWSCHGSGRKDSMRTMGDDHCHDHKPCFSCNGTGWSNCQECHTQGQVKCNVCKGFGQLKCYVELKVFWKNNKDEFVVEETDLPDELIKDVHGKVIFNERYPRVQAVQVFPDPRIVKASHELVEKHSTAFNLERMLEQRHCIQLVPVAVIKYEYKGKEGEFFMYGNEHKVWFPNYPAKCTCTII